MADIRDFLVCALIIIVLVFLFSGDPDVFDAVTDMARNAITKDACDG